MRRLTSRTGSELAMSYIVRCTEQVFPCPTASQEVVAGPTIEDFDALGITGEGLTLAFSFGFGLIVASALLGIAVGAVIRLIKQA